MMRNIVYAAAGIGIGAVAVAFAAAPIKYPSSGNIMPMTQLPVALTWTAGISPDKVPSFTTPQTFIVQSIVCRPETVVGAAAKVSVVKASSGTVLSNGTPLHTGTGCDANLNAAGNQGLPLAPLAALTLAAGDTIGLRSSDTSWTTGNGVGVITVVLQPPQ
jgi:hypothetical protein